MRCFKKEIQNILGFLVRYTGIFKLMRLLEGYNAPLIINYHDPSPDIFRTHVRYLSKRFTFITLDELVNALKDKDLTFLPPKPIVFTFDDGHKGNFDLLDIFKEYNIRPTIYVCSGIVNTSRKFWFKAVSNPQPLKQLIHDQRIKVLKSDFNFELKDEHKYKERQALSKNELLEMSRSVDIGSHTRFHPILTTMFAEQLNSEILDSKIEIEQLVNKSVNHFAYPNGDYSVREVDLVKKSGYRSARTINSNVIRISDDLYELPNIGISDDATINVLCLQISRLPIRVKNLIKNGRFNGIYSPINIEL